MNDLEGALKDYNEALRLGKNVDLEVAKAKEFGLNSSALYFNRGVVLQKQGQLEAAVRDYTEAIDIDPSSAPFPIITGPLLKWHSTNPRKL